ncbi:MAG: glycosyltransferase [Proteobacteria bacterium]|nr:glycosyltransferase [Pseudomonadota bacterium]NCA28351.1 glycosyltransferase [Pseudomonadota bacterium]
MDEISHQKVVLQIIPSLESGGVERGTIDIAKTLKSAGFRPIVMSRGGIMVYDLKEAKIEHVNLNVKSKNPFTIFKNINKIQKILEDNAVDIVHVRSRAPMWSAYFACKKTKTKLVSTIHGTYSLNFLFWQVFPLKKLYNSMMLRADQIIVVSNYIKNYLLKYYKGDFENKVDVIQRGVDLKYFNSEKISKNRVIDLIKNWNLPEDKKIILMPARFTSWKGHEFLIEALAKVKNDFFCVMVGSDHGHKKFRKKLEQKIVRENLAEKIRIVGPCRDMQSAYNVSHFVVAPSVRPEAFGRISIEAQASCKIIIATKIGGALETIIDKETGYLVEPNDVNALADIIDFVLQMPKEQAEKMGLAGRKNIEKNFSNDLMCQKTLEVYQKLLN